ncbi:MAG: phosphoenolpyruvate carboxylase, partial [Anaerolineae bacterium]|nr:phosphoenolpyruvate carboxylase [Anaerolineae bacterium]
DHVLNESVGAAVGTLKETGLTVADIEELLNHLRVRLVLTAHPSEAKRKEVLLKMHDLTEKIELQDRQALVPREIRVMETTLREEIEELWQTRTTRASSKTVSDEVDFGLYFLTSVIMDVTIELYDDIEYYLNEYYPEGDWSNPPGLLRFGSWIGGDRDGNPNVTSDVTLETLATLREAARRVYLDDIAYLREHLTQSIEEIGVSPELRAAVQDDPRLNELYPGEIYRQQMTHIWEKLKADAYPTNRELLDDMLLIDSSLRQNNGLHVAKGSLQHLIRKIRLFGLHLVPLDIREDARLQVTALDELFRYYDIAENYTELSEAEKQVILTREIRNKRPLFPQDVSIFSETTQRIINTWRMIKTAHERYGTVVIDSVIASMSKQPSDTLAMLLLASEVGIENDVDLVPLFETIDDLHNGADTMLVLFANPEYHKHMEARGVRHGLRQQIMIGYSDSSKDGGYLASNWNLYTAQQRLTAICADEDVALQLFHGRGGSIGRGGGPTNRSILAQPPLTLKGGIKITEQGEVIAYRYANPNIARRHLNQVMHASLIALGAPVEINVKPAWSEAMNTLSEGGRVVYRKLVYETAGFLDYWQQATPINELARLPISSRPAKRSKKGGFDSIRAIPWVFSWMQSRAIIPSWYGVGSAMEQYINVNPDGLALLREMYERWPFFNNLIDNVQLDVAKADIGIATLYAALVADEALRDQIFGAIRAEHERTCHWICAILEQDELLDNTPVIKRSIERRNPYIDPLNFIQVELLRELRELEPETPHYEAILDAVLATVNGIAAGMKTTG